MIFLVSYVSFYKEEVISELKDYGRIVYDSPVINVVGIETKRSKSTIESIEGVTSVDAGITGKLRY